MDEANPRPLPPAAYVNFLRVGLAESEVFLAFAQTSHDAPASAHLVASLVTSPRQAKAMLQALTEAVARYEARFGAIPEPAAAAPAAAAQAGGAIAAHPLPSGRKVSRG